MRPFVNLHFADVAMNRPSGRNDMNSVGIAPPASKMHVTNAYMSMLSYGTAGQYAASPVLDAGRGRTSALPLP